MENKTSPMRFGRYQVIELLGQGAMATVYKALDPNLNRKVAIKVIHTHLHDNASLLTRFTSEAKTVASLRNQHIVEVFDYGVEGQQYLVMEFIDGPTLQAVLNLLQGPMPPEICAAFISQAAEGLATAEKFGVVHRDIKPENLMLTRSGFLKVADFGIAHISEQNLTQTGSVLGSPNFMSPEQVNGGKPSSQTDMFSLGAVFYTALTGVRPFVGQNIPMIFRRICDEPHPPVLSVLPTADPELAEIIEILLHKNPEDRGQGARWVQNQLRAWLGRKGIFDAHDTAKIFLDGILPPPPIESVPESSLPAKKSGNSKPNTATLSTAKKNKSLSRLPLFMAIGLAFLALVAVSLVLFWPEQKSNKPEEKPAATIAKMESVTSTLTPSDSGISQSINQPIAETKPVLESSIEALPVVTEVEKPKPKPKVMPSEKEPSGAVTLTVISAPPFAEVYLDGQQIGATPLRNIKTRSGRHTIKLVHRDYLGKDTVLTIPPGEKTVKFRLF